jgi:putative ABC transport system permease protein
MIEVEQVLLSVSAALLLLFLAVFLSRRLALNLEETMVIAGCRGVVQLLILASLILLLFSYPLYVSVLALATMVVLAGYTTYRHASTLKHALYNATVSIAISALLLTLPLFALGIFPLEPRFVIPVGSIIIGNSMNTCSLALERYLGEVRNRREEIEAYLILGASPQVAIQKPLRQSLRSSLIPTLDNMKNLGVIWIPGIMTGMLISGESPYLAAGTQIILFVTILLSGLASASLLLHLSIRSLFNNACQLAF